MARVEPTLLQALTLQSPSPPTSINEDTGHLLQETPGLGHLTYVRVRASNLRFVTLEADLHAPRGFAARQAGEFQRQRLSAPIGRVAGLLSSLRSFLDGILISTGERLPSLPRASRTGQSFFNPLGSGLSGLGLGT